MRIETRQIDLPEILKQKM